MVQEKLRVLIVYQLLVVQEEDHQEQGVPQEKYLSLNQPTGVLLQAHLQVEAHLQVDHREDLLDQWYLWEEHLKLSQPTGVPRLEESPHQLLSQIVNPHLANQFLVNHQLQHLNLIMDHQWDKNPLEEPHHPLGLPFHPF